VLREIAGVAPDDLNVRLYISFATACASAQEGEHDKAALQFGSVLTEYAQLLEAEQELREDICFRRAIELVVSARNREAVPFLEEALSFRTLTIEDQQMASFQLALTYEKLQEGDLAVREFLRTISFNLLNWNEAEARYRAACSYFTRGAYAQAKHHLEKALNDYSKYKGADVSVALRSIYGLLSRACRYLGEKDNEKRYANLSKNCT
jgi:tetratricopeptide (TPR) repeat protein